MATSTSGARPACPSPPIRPLPSGVGRNLAPKTTKVVIVGWWRVTINDMAHSTGLSAVAARACARWREVVKAGTDSRRSPAIAVAPSSTIGMARTVRGATRAARARQAAACAHSPKRGRRWRRKDSGRTLWLVFRLSLFVSASRICAGVFALRICMLVAGLGRRVPPAALFPGHLRGVAFGESPGGGSTSSSPLVVFGRGETRSGGITLWFLAPVRARYPFLKVRAYGFGSAGRRAWSSQVRWGKKWI